MEAIEEINGMELLIRAVQPDDAENIVALLNPIIETGGYTVFDRPFTVEFEREYITNFPESGVFLVAVRSKDQKIVGFQSMEPFADYTHAFDHVGVLGTYVDLSCLRQGIASSLFKATFEVARQKGYEKFFTFIRADNQAALTTYTSQGFTVIGTAHKHARINGRYIDEIIVEKILK